MGYVKKRKFRNLNLGMYTSAIIAFLLYSAYLILRNSIDEEQKSAKISSIYNVFAFPLMIVLLIILPRITDSLHPGNGGNPAIGKYFVWNVNSFYRYYPSFFKYF